MTEMSRIRFERPYRSLHGDEYNLIRSPPGYQVANVDRAFFFWREGRESAA